MSPVKPGCVRPRGRWVFSPEEYLSPQSYRGRLDNLPIFPILANIQSVGSQFSFMTVLACIMKLKWKATISFTWCFNMQLISNICVPKKKEKKKGGKYILCVRRSISYENLSPWKAGSMAKHIFSKYEFGRITYCNVSGKCTQEQLITGPLQCVARCRSTTNTAVNCCF